MTWLKVAEHSFIRERNCCVIDFVAKTPSTPHRRNLKTALLLRLGLPSTLIRQENEAFWKRSWNRRNWKRCLCFLVWTENIWKTEIFENVRHHGNHVILLAEFSSKTNPKWPPGGCCIFILLWTEDTWRVFKFFRHSIGGGGGGKVVYLKNHTPHLQTNHCFWKTSSLLKLC